MRKVKSHFTRIYHELFDDRRGKKTLTTRESSKCVKLFARERAPTNLVSYGRNALKVIKVKCRGDMRFSRRKYSLKESIEKLWLVKRKKRKDKARVCLRWILKVAYLKFDDTKTSNTDSHTACYRKIGVCTRARVLSAHSRISLFSSF